MFSNAEIKALKLGVSLFLKEVKRPINTSGHGSLDCVGSTVGCSVVSKIGFITTDVGVLIVSWVLPTLFTKAGLSMLLTKYLCKAKLTGQCCCYRRVLLMRQVWATTWGNITWPTDVF